MPGRRWTRDEEVRLEELAYAGDDDATIAAKLGRSLCAVRWHRSQALGLDTAMASGRPRQYDRREIARLMAEGRTTLEVAAATGAHVETVRNGMMHTGRGMANVTRFTFGEQATPEGHGDLSQLGHSPADSLLRKLCASCHLGQPLHQIETVQPIGKRGGGCLACHLPHVYGPDHPVLTAKVGDEQ
jgi:DNA-binding CsgD family transcriptional regulator